jgi:hypothetical protein
LAGGIPKKEASTKEAQQKKLNKKAVALKQRPNQTN